jgi:TonB family protein
MKLREMNIIIRFLTTSLIFITPYMGLHGQSQHIKRYRPIPNGTYEIVEMNRDSLPIFKGTLKSLEPPVRDGRFYFFSSKGYVQTMGQYARDVPFGTWVYYNEVMDTVRVIDYSPVWRYLEARTQSNKVDSIFKTNVAGSTVAMLHDGSPADQVDQMPVFQEDETLESFNKYIEEHLYYPAYAIRKGLMGTVRIQFRIDTEGMVRDPKIIHGINPDLNMEALRVLLESPRWKPGISAGQPVNALLTHDFRFEYERLNVEEIRWLWDQVDAMPLFDGNIPHVTFRKYIAANLRYPEKSAWDGSSGRVVVQFTVQPDGTLDDIRVIESVDPYLDREAIRVVKSSPLWTPGESDGEKVSVAFTFPINFILN